MRIFVPPEVWPRLQLTLPEEGEELGYLLRGGRGGGMKVKQRGRKLLEQGLHALGQRLLSPDICTSVHE